MSTQESNEPGVERSAPAPADGAEASDVRAREDIEPAPPSSAWRDPKVDTAKRRIPARNVEVRDDLRAPPPTIQVLEIDEAGPDTPPPATLPPPANYKELRRETARRPAYNPATTTGETRDPRLAATQQLRRARPDEGTIGKGTTMLIVGLVSVGVLCLGAAGLIVMKNDAARPERQDETVRAAPIPSTTPPPAPSTPQEGTPPVELSVEPSAPSAVVPRGSASVAARASTSAVAAPPPPGAPPRSSAPRTPTPAPSSSHPPGLQFLKQNL